MPRRILALLFVLTLTACSSGKPATTPGAPPATDYPRFVEPSPHRQPIGITAQLANDTVTAAITLADAKIIKAPSDWGDPTVLIATATYDVTAGSMRFEETGFTLVTPDGARDRAHTVASDDGLPGKALGSGDLPAPGKAKGLVTFEAPTTLAGYSIELTSGMGVVAIWTLS